MGKVVKRKVNTVIKKSNSSTNAGDNQWVSVELDKEIAFPFHLDRPKSVAAGGSQMRDKATIKRIKMYKNFKPQRDRSGKITKAAPFQERLPMGSVARVEPNRKWFGQFLFLTARLLSSYQISNFFVYSRKYQSHRAVSTPAIPRTFGQSEERPLSGGYEGNQIAHNATQSDC